MYIIHNRTTFYYVTVWLIKFVSFIENELINAGLVLGDMLGQVSRRTFSKYVKRTLKGSSRFQSIM